ncbi:MAG TPA: peptidase-C39 like family protein [Vicinamibacteria bacterium]|nr:peptidase-C39 like family protein [Vicinamibacteria bacterium]
MVRRAEARKIETLSLPIDIRAQPDETTCGPTCLDAVYRFYGDDVTLETIIAQTGRLEQGGTLAVFLACHALAQGYIATIYTYNLQVFDPSWFRDPGIDLRERLKAQARHKRAAKLRVATDAYLEFLERGGLVQFQELSAALIRKYLKQAVPLLTGLSATYLYQTPREHGSNSDYDDVRGEPSGHFVVVCGYEPSTQSVRIADPLLPNPMADGQYYTVGMNRLIGAIYLGVLTYDANFLVVEPRERSR